MKLLVAKSFCKKNIACKLNGDFPKFIIGEKVNNSEPFSGCRWMLLLLNIQLMEPAQITRIFKELSADKLGFEQDNDSNELPALLLY